MYYIYVCMDIFMYLYYIMIYIIHICTCMYVVSELGKYGKYCLFLSLFLYMKVSAK